MTRLDTRLAEKCEWLKQYRAAGMASTVAALQRDIDRLLDARRLFMRDRDRN